MLRGLLSDHILHLRECMLISSSLVVSLFAGFSVYVLSGKKTDVRVRALLGYIIVAVLFLVCPVTASVLRIVTGTYYDSPDMWNILPLIPLGAIMTSMLFDELYSREKKISVLAVILFACAVLLCGSLGRVTENSAGRPENAGTSDKEIAEMIVTKGLVSEGSLVIASDDMISYIRVTYPEIRTLYGRDMWDGRLTKNRYGFYDQWVIDIHDDMVRVYQGETDLAPDLSIRAFDSGVSCIVFPGDADEASLKAAGCVTTPVVTSSGRNYILACPGGNRLNGEE